MRAILTFVSLILFTLICSGQNDNTFNILDNKPYFKIPSNITTEDYLPKTIIFKIKPEYRNICQSNRIEHGSFNAILNDLSVVNFEKKFPLKNEPDRAFNDRGEKLVDLSLIYELNYQSDVDLEVAINRLYSSGIIIYAEPHYIPKLLYSPNDPQNTMVYALKKMNVFDAWEISQGDTNIVIGITDTGVDFDHKDLVGNIKYNYNDTINGIDDDGDGYKDNFRGWDLGEKDNFPQYNVNNHGVHVSGIAAASTDNATGISGVGFKCKFLPVKISDAEGRLTKDYDGIIYAADQGCQIINCSWGGSGGGQLGQEVINYATINKNALVVCGAGNNGDDSKFYPAVYDNALAVAGTDKSDKKWSGSSYYYFVDVSAPGQDIYSTIPGNTYDSRNGTSMAAPNVAGAAAIVKSQFPTYTALQIGEQLKVTADDISSLNSNEYIGKLGTGRINLKRALTETTSPSVIMTKRLISSSNPSNSDINPFNIDDTLKISGVFTNYLSPTGILSAKLSTSSIDVNILNDSLMLGEIATLESVDKSEDPFKVIIKPNSPPNFNVPFKIILSDGSYSTTIYFDVNIIMNNQYINITVNDVATSISSIGRIGYNKTNGINGLGFTYMGSSSLLYEAGLMIGNSENAVSSPVRGSISANGDFSSIVRIKKVSNVVSDFDAKGSFKDYNAANPLNVTVNQSAFAWSSAGNRKYIIVTYHIVNKGSNLLSNLYAGIFADWNIMNHSLNRLDFDVENQMAYAWNSQGDDLYAGVKLLSITGSVNHYAIDNVPGGNGGIDLTDGFDTREKWISLSSNRYQAGFNSDGSDVASVVSSGPYDLLPGDSAIVAFALLAGDSLEDIQASAVAAQAQYDSKILALNVTTLKPAKKLWLGAYPNPASNQVTIEFVLPKEASVKISIYNTLGQEVLVPINKIMETGKHSIIADISNFENGIYLYKLTADDLSISGKMNVVNF